MRALSILRKTLAKNDETKVGLWKRSEILRWLAVAKAVLDFVLSVASSIIVSKLMTSGDVEKNPGPGGRWQSALIKIFISVLKYPHTGSINFTEIA